MEKCANHISRISRRECALRVLAAVAKRCGHARAHEFELTVASRARCQQFARWHLTAARLLPPRSFYGGRFLAPLILMSDQAQPAREDSTEHDDHAAEEQEA